MKYRWLLLMAGVLPAVGHAQKRVGDLTLIYNFGNYQHPGFQQENQFHNQLFLKGNLSRSEVNSSQFSSVTIYDSKAGSGVILREVNGQKLLIRMNEENWEQKNKRYASLSFARTSEMKTIAGYSCSQAKASTADGFEIMVFYTRELVPENRYYDPPFKNLEGLPLEYELQKGNMHIRYTLASINLNPVPASRFDIPTSGYREMTYDESLKLKMTQSLTEMAFSFLHLAVNLFGHLNANTQELEVGTVTEVDRRTHFHFVLVRKD